MQVTELCLLAKALRATSITPDSPRWPAPGRPPDRSPLAWARFRSSLSWPDHAQRPTAAAPAEGAVRADRQGGTPGPRPPRFVTATGQTRTGSGPSPPRGGYPLRGPSTRRRSMVGASAQKAEPGVLPSDRGTGRPGRWPYSWYTTAAAAVTGLIGDAPAAARAAACGVVRSRTGTHPRPAPGRPRGGPAMMCCRPAPTDRSAVDRQPTPNTGHLTDDCARPPTSPGPLTPFPSTSHARPADPEDHCGDRGDQGNGGDRGVSRHHHGRRPGRWRQIRAVGHSDRREHRGGRHRRGDRFPARGRGHPDRGRARLGRVRGRRRGLRSFPAGDAASGDESAAAGPPRGRHAGGTCRCHARRSRDTGRGRSAAIPPGSSRTR